MTAPVPEQREDVPRCMKPTFRAEPADIAALRAVEMGVASGLQQQRALKFIVESLCGAFDHTYYSDPHDHAYASGRRGAGLLIISYLNKASTSVDIKEPPT